MSYADKIFKDNLKKIMDEPWEIDNRAKWEDGSPIATKRIVSVVNVYNLEKEFPALTIRPTPIKSCFNEIDWIYIKRSNNINDLKGGIWDSWADESGSIGKAYGYQVSKPIFGYNNQMDYILGEAKKNPTSRRLQIELWNINELLEMNLPPCVHHIQLLIKSGKAHLIMKQRSNDFLVANNWNVVQYSILLHMIAKHLNLQVGTLTHVIGDMHIYNKHEKQAIELLNRRELETPEFWINPNINNFYDFTEDDFKLIYKEKHPQLQFDVAI